MSPAPTISVLLPVHNAGAFLAPALASLEGQTCREFEVVAVDDGSTDGSGEELLAAANRWSWLRVVRQPCGGIAAALNRAIAESRGEFLARMDADDIAHPNRLDRQLRFLRSHPEVGVCGTWFRVFGHGAPVVVPTPVEDDAIRARLIFACPFAHPTVMMRRSVLEQLATVPYDPAALDCEDYDLWVRLAGQTRFHNLPEPLLDYRMHPHQVTNRSPQARFARVQRLRGVLLERIGLRTAAIDEAAHGACGLDTAPSDLPLPRISAWLQTLRAAIPAAGWCSPRAIQHECSEAWWRVVQHSAAQPGAIRHYLGSPLTPKYPRSLWRALRLARQRAAAP